MARIKIQIPETKIFSTSVTLRISDINYGGHLANDAILAIAHEVRIRFLQSLGYSEKNIEGKGIIMTDAGIVYKSQGYHGDEITIHLSVDDVTRLGFDLIYLYTHTQTKKELARVKTGITFFDYESNKISSIPERFNTKLLEITKVQP